jgi:dihydrofolate reductase
MISAIVAMSDNHVIGNKGQIPWHLPADLSRMRELSVGHPIIMGRATHEAIGRTLPDRLNIVISSDPHYKVSKGSVLVGSLDEAFNLDEVKAAEEVFIFGGESIYLQAMPITQRIYLTIVHLTTEGDKFFKYMPDEWTIVSEEKHQKDQNNLYDYEFITLDRRR